MDISKYAKADVLRVLYNNARVMGMGYLPFRPGDLTKEEAEKLLEENTYFDYLYGRVMKVDLSSDKIKTALYNRDNGKDAAEKAIATLDQ